MSIHLVTKGRLGEALPNATRGYLYVFGELIPRIEAIIPNLVFRRVAITKVFKRSAVKKIFRREDV